MIQKAAPVVADPNTLHVENIGPVESLDIPTRPGTVIVLEGPNGAGKTTVLDAVGAIANKRGAGLTSLDGTTGGFVEGFGVTIKVARGGANRRLGDGGVVIGIEDKLNIADFVDPPVKEAGAADLRRIKALVQLTQTSPAIEDYHALVGGPERFSELVKDLVFDAADPVGTADKIKRALEAASRVAEQTAVNHHGSAVAKLKENDGVNMQAPHDEQFLQLNLEQAISAESGLKQQRHHAQQSAAKREQAERALAEFRASIAGGATLEQCQQKLQIATQSEAAASQAVADARDALRSAESGLADARFARTSAESSLKAAQEQQQSMQGWERAIAETADVANPTDEQLAAAIETVQAARNAMVEGVRVRDALQREASAKVLEQKAAEARAISAKLRDAAQGTMDVLSVAVKSLSPRITIDGNFRLVVKGHVRGDVFFGDLSAGERWRLAFDLAIEAFKKRGERGLLAIPQEAWEGLDEHNRREVVEAVSQTDLVVFAAQASRDPNASGITVHVLGMPD